MEIELEDIFTGHYEESKAEGQDICGTFELGENGYTACLSTDFDLLQLTSPSPDGCGIVFARGNFPDDPQSILARVQRPGFGFGLRIPEKIQYRWNEYLRPKERRERRISGYLNYRWPITKEALVSENGSGIAETVTAWYMKNGTLYQITKISVRPSARNHGTGTIEIPYKLGDRLRFGCSCTGCPATTDTRFHKLYEHTASLRHDDTLLVVDDQNLQTRVYMQWFVNGGAKEVKLCQGKDLGSVDVGSTGTLKVGADPVIVVHMVSLRGPSETDEVFHKRPPSMLEVENALGINTESGCWGKLWRADLANEGTGDLFPVDLSKDPETHQLKLNIIARTVEYLISVASLPLSGKRQPVTLISNIIASLTVDLHTLLYVQTLCAKLVLC